MEEGNTGERGMPGRRKTNLENIKKVHFELWVNFDQNSGGQRNRKTKLKKTRRRIPDKVGLGETSRKKGTSLALKER